MSRAASVMPADTLLREIIETSSGNGVDGQ
jgi:hypothetical protein